jgi:DNA-binding PadR family transcriptional regulator
MNPHEDVAGFLPLNPRVFLILLAFAEGSRYGYEVKKSVEEKSSGQVRLDVGSLYRAIAKLLDGGLIREADAGLDSDEDDPRRRYYELTPLGKDVTAAEARRLKDLVEVALVDELVESTGSGR